MRAARLHALCLLAAFGSATTAHAQVSEQRLADYREAAERGVEAYNEGDLATARQYFERAASILPNPRVHRLLGRVALAEGSYVEAAQLFHRALTADDAGHPLSDELRRQVETELLPSARAHVADYRLDLEPSDALLTVDGRAAVVTGGYLVLPPGAHTLAVEAPGLERLERTVQAAAGASEVLRLHLGEAEPGAAPFAGETVHAPPAAGVSVAGLGITLVGAAVALAGAIFIGVGWSEANTVDSTPRWLAVEGAHERARWMIPTGYVMTGLGLAAVVSGLVIFAVDGPAPNEGAHVSLLPGGLTLEGWF
jgi:hypothetical protein